MKKLLIVIAALSLVTSAGATDWAQDDPFDAQPVVISRQALWIHTAMAGAVTYVVARSEHEIHARDLQARAASRDCSLSPADRQLQAERAHRYMRQADLATGAAIAIFGLTVYLGATAIRYNGNSLLVDKRF